MSISSAIFKPNLRIFFKLDESLLSEEFVEKIGREEGRTDYVDAEKARDYMWTEEIMTARTGAALVDEEGEIIAEFAGEGATPLIKAEAARSSAKVTFDIAIDDAEADVVEDGAEASYEFEPE